MDLVERQTKIAIEYVTNIANGGIDESYLSDDMCAWSLSMRRVPRSTYWPRLKNVKAIFPVPLEMTVDSITAQPHRIAVQSHSQGTLFTGVEYTNDYLFLIEFNKGGLIRHVREYFDVQRLREILMPALLQYEAENGLSVA